MRLLPEWQEELAKLPPPEPAAMARFVVPLQPAFFHEQITQVDNLDCAREMVELAYQRPISFIGIDTEFKHDRPPVEMDRNKTWTDPRSIHPLILSLAMAEPMDSGVQLYRFVADLRRPEVLSYVQEVLWLPVTFVGHFLQVELFCLWQLGLDPPDHLWDSWACEKAMSLGVYHSGYQTAVTATTAEQIQAKQEVEERKASFFSLLDTCRRYGVEHPYSSDKARLQQTFLTHPDDQPFSQEQIGYAAADAEAAARLYPHQVQAATMKGVLPHLVTVEMPWVATNAQVNWNGVRIDPDKRQGARDACARHAPVLLEQLKQYGIENPRSTKELTGFFEAKGLLDAFRRKGRYSFDKDQMRRVEHLHPSIRLIRSARRVLDLQADPIMREDLAGVDGRMHPEHRQLGTETGRQTSQWPNILGLDRVLRPMIVPDAGYGIGEVDLSQIEPGIAAAVYHDDNLVRMFNQGDVYSAMAQTFYADELSEEDRVLSGSDFKRKHSPLRNRMKNCTLGIIYGLTPHGLAVYLNTDQLKAKALLDRFMMMFPALKQALTDVANYGGMRGYATTNTGLRRLRMGSGPPSRWERNWMTNHPVQGSAAVVFKAAGNRLSRLYRRYEARIIVPFHDAYIFEAPSERLQEVANLTERVMCDTVQEYFPCLIPRVEVNISRPDCWNKDGKADAFEKWLEDPLHTT